jgi:CDP-diacylglycerol--glycerol-3-phosphate 3-phosphatidyltransferase
VVVTETTAATAEQQAEPSNWNLPNVLTSLRILMVPLFAWLLMRDGGMDDTSRLLATLVFILAMVTDWLDGYLARKWNLVTAFGKIADPIADKALTGVAFIGLAILDEVPFMWWAAFLILSREILITVLRFVIIRYGVMPAGRGGKLKTVLQTVTLVVLLLPLTDDWVVITAILLWTTVAVTLATGIDYLLKADRLVREAKRASAEQG